MFLLICNHTSSFWTGFILLESWSCHSLVMCVTFGIKVFLEEIILLDAVYMCSALGPTSSNLQEDTCFFLLTFSFHAWPPSWWNKMTGRGVGVWEDLKKDDVIYEQPLIFPSYTTNLANLSAASMVYDWGLFMVCLAPNSWYVIVSHHFDSHIWGWCIIYK